MMAARVVTDRAAAPARRSAVRHTRRRAAARGAAAGGASGGEGGARGSRGGARGGRGGAQRRREGALPLPGGLERAVAEHWSDGALTADILKADWRGKRRAAEDALRVREAVNTNHRSIVRFHSSVVAAVKDATLRMAGAAPSKGGSGADDADGAPGARTTGAGQAQADDGMRCPDVLPESAKARVRFEHMMREADADAASPNDPLRPVRRTFSRQTKQGEFLRDLAGAIVEGMGNLEKGQADDDEDLEVPTEPEEILVVVTALASLGELDSRSGAQLLASVAANPDADAREALVHALFCAVEADQPEAIGNIGVSVLISLTEDDDPSVQDAAREAVEGIKSALRQEGADE